MKIAKTFAAFLVVFAAPPSVQGNAIADVLEGLPEAKTEIDELGDELKGLRKSSDAIQKKQASLAQSMNEKEDELIAVELKMDDVEEEMIEVAASQGEEDEGELLQYVTSVLEGEEEEDNGDFEDEGNEEADEDEIEAPFVEDNDGPDDEEGHRMLRAGNNEEDHRGLGIFDIFKPSCGKYGAGCWAGDPCCGGYSCHPGKHKCYNSPRREGQPCVAGYGCGSGLTCEAGHHVCRREGKLNDSCHLTRPCASGYSCHGAFIQKCYNDPRKEGQPCVIGLNGECGKGLKCDAFIGECEKSSSWSISLSTDNNVNTIGENELCGDKGVTQYQVGLVLSLQGCASGLECWFHTGKGGPRCIYPENKGKFKALTKGGKHGYCLPWGNNGDLCRPLNKGTARPHTCSGASTDGYLPATCNQKCIAARCLADPACKAYTWDTSRKAGKPKGEISSSNPVSPNSRWQCHKKV